MTIRFYCPPIWGLLLPQNLKFVTPLNTRPHSTLEYKTPYRTLFGRDPVEGLVSFGIPKEIVVEVTTEEEINQ